MGIAFAESQTRENLMRAFAGESQARNRYEFAAARDILVADYINGTKNTMQGTAKPLVVPQLAGHDSAWYLLCASRPIRPLIWQQRKKPKFVSKTAETDDNVFMRKTFLYGADYRGNAGFGFWQMAYGGDGTAE